MGNKAYGPREKTEIDPVKKFVHDKFIGVNGIEKYRVHDPVITDGTAPSDAADDVKMMTVAVWLRLPGINILYLHCTARINVKRARAKDNRPKCGRSVGGKTKDYAIVDRTAGFTSGLMNTFTTGVARQFVGLALFYGTGGGARSDCIFCVIIAQGYGCIRLGGCFRRLDR